MIGWWVPNPPVTTGRSDVLVTTYAGKGKALLAIASWAPDTVSVPLAVDWKALGLDSARAPSPRPPSTASRWPAGSSPANRSRWPRRVVGCSSCISGSSAEDHLMTVDAEPETLSLVRGDVLFRLQRAIGLIPPDGLGLIRRALFYALLTWLPIAVWAFWRGRVRSAARSTNHCCSTSGCTSAASSRSPSSSWRRASRTGWGPAVAPQFCPRRHRRRWRRPPVRWCTTWPGCATAPCRGSSLPGSCWRGSSSRRTRTQSHQVLWASGQPVGLRPGVWRAGGISTWHDRSTWPW